MIFKPLGNREAALRLPKVSRKQLVDSYTADEDTDNFMSCTHGKYFKKISRYGYALGESCFDC